MATRVYRSMPTIAEMRLAGSGSVEDVAQVEAGKVIGAIATVGAYNSVVFDDPVTVAVISQCYGGWVKLCSEITEDKKAIFLGQFRKMYVAYKNQGVRAASPKMAGMVERDNSAMGMIEHIPPPVFVGDHEKGQRLLEMCAPENRREIGTKQNLRQLTANIGKGAKTNAGI
jgi:hypothetical protein